MVPMRSIPFRVVALLGMNDGVFPRSPRPIEFDLVRNGKTARREADRSPRDDDRYLFLETVCAAREALIVTYAGRSLRDSRELPASVSVSELLECLCGPVSKREAPRPLVVPHRLQASARLFRRQRLALFSHSEEYQRAAVRRQRSRSEAAPFLERLGPVPREGALLLDDFVRFWRSPPAFLLNRRLGIYLRHEKVDLRSREPLELAALDQWRIGDPLVLHRLEQLDPLLPSGCFAERASCRSACSVARSWPRWRAMRARLPTRRGDCATELSCRRSNSTCRLRTACGCAAR